MNNRWLMEEEVLLAIVWLEVQESTDLLNERSFWNVVTRKFNEQTNGV
jgi:hypothetical protein